MIVKGFVDKSFRPPAPAVRAFTVISKLEIEGYTKFLIDTGASSTAMLDRDREQLGIDLEKMEKAPVKVGGIGGLVDTYVARNTELIFKTQNGEHVETLDILVLRHDLDKMSRDIVERVLAMPSLLGRDILRKFRFTYDEKSSEVSLEAKDTRASNHSSNFSSLKFVKVSHYALLNSLGSGYLLPHIRELWAPRT